MEKILVVLLLLVATPGFAKSTKSEDFDDDAYTWNESYCDFSYSCQIIDSPLGKTGLSWKATFFDANCSDRPSMGDELSLGGDSCVDDCDKWIGYRIFFNHNTLSAGEDMIIQQMHDTPDAGGEVYRSSIYSLYSEASTKDLTVTIRGCKDETQLSNSCSGNTYIQANHEAVADPVMDSWNDFVIHAHTSVLTADGSLEIFLNGESVYLKENIYFGYNDDSSPYWKFGIYCFSCDCDDSVPREIIYDDIISCEGSDCVYSDVAPSGYPVPAGES